MDKNSEVEKEVKRMSGMGNSIFNNGMLNLLLQMVSDGSMKPDEALSRARKNDIPIEPNYFEKAYEEAQKNKNKNKR